MKDTHYWDPGLYDSSHRFVFDYGRNLVEVLAPKPGEGILDVGCGTGHLTYEIAQSGARVTGIDKSPAMIAQARQNYPKLRFELGDVANFRSPEAFDAVFSNAALHWMIPPEAVVRAIRAALKPGGRFVAEFGGKGNIATIIAAVGSNPWYFPGIGEYAALLEAHGLEVTSAMLFERPTKLEGEDGLRQWLEMFFHPALTPDEVERVVRELRPRLNRDGAWFADYRRLRIVANAV
jgi:SAM-dependent methyltransferase